RLREDQMEQLIGAVTHAVQPEARQRFESMARATADAAPAVWFRQLLLALLPDAGLLPLHPRQLSPFVAPRLLQEEPGALAAQVATSIAELRSLDLAVPIAEASPLPFFVLDAAGERHRVTPATSDPGALELRDSSGTRFERATLERLAHEEPHRFSPDALMRPLLQDSLLQPLAVVVGPTEYSYHLELASAYAARGIVRPALIPRLRARLLDQSLAAAVRETGIDPEALASERRPLEELVPSPEAEVVVSELESRASSLLAYLNELQQRADITGGAHKRAVRLEQRWRGEIDKFAALLRRDLSGDVTAHRDAVQKALEQLWPGGDDAERTVSVLAAADRYGFDLFAEIAAACDPYDARARLLVQQPLTAHAFEAQSKAN
ncbi:MAG: bacillithiol biosynthesis BshC, partial [Planctomycetota bacterium]